METQELFFRLFYDNGLERPEKDATTGKLGTSKEVFPGLKAVVTKFRDQNMKPTVTRSAIRLETPSCIIVTRFSGTGGTSFGGISEDVMEAKLVNDQAAQPGQKLLFVTSAKEDGFCWAQEDWTNVAKATWTSHATGLAKPACTLDECVQGIYTQVMQCLGRNPGG